MFAVVWGMWKGGGGMLGFSMTLFMFFSSRGGLSS